MGRPLREYAYYKQGEHVCNGTRHELAMKLGVSKKVISNYIHSTKKNGSFYDIQLLPLEEGSPFVKAKVNTIKNLIEKEKITQRILAEWICVNPKTLSSKLNKRTRFTEDEIEKIEEVFRLEKGELIKNG